MSRQLRLAVVIPCYKVRSHICDVIDGISSVVDTIYVVDDACPEHSGEHVELHCRDSRVTVLRNPTNLGVGGAVLHGYRQALIDGADVAIKMDGDGQMDPHFLPHLLYPILMGQADYTKGNRFHPLASRNGTTSRRGTRRMPFGRWLGNSALSILHKATSGYWNITDPTNGYTAIHRRALEGLDPDTLSRGYFFEHDMLFQLNLIEAVVADVPMPAIYADEASSLKISRVLREFPALLVKRCLRRLWLRYFVHDFNVASLEILLGMPLFFGGLLYGIERWLVGVQMGQLNSAGTVMLSALPIILGFQLLLAALSYDIVNMPKIPLCRRLPDRFWLEGEVPNTRWPERPAQVERHQDELQ